MKTYKIIAIDDSYVYVKKYIWSKKQRFLYCPFSYNDIYEGKLNVGDKVKIVPCVEPNASYFSISKTN